MVPAIRCGDAAAVRPARAGLAPGRRGARHRRRGRIMLRLTAGRPERENDRIVTEAFTFKHGCTPSCGLRAGMHTGAAPGSAELRHPVRDMLRRGRGMPITGRVPSIERGHQEGHHHHIRRAPSHRARAVACHDAVPTRVRYCWGIRRALRSSDRPEMGRGANSDVISSVALEPDGVSNIARQCSSNPYGNDTLRDSKLAGKARRSNIGTGNAVRSRSSSRSFS